MAPVSGGIGVGEEVELLAGRERLQVREAGERHVLDDERRVVFQRHATDDGVAIEGVGARHHDLMRAPGFGDHFRPAHLDRSAAGMLGDLGAGLAGSARPVAAVLGQRQQQVEGPGIPPLSEGFPTERGTGQSHQRAARSVDVDAELTAA